MPNQWRIQELMAGDDPLSFPYFVPLLTYLFCCPSNPGSRGGTVSYPCGPARSYASDAFHACIVSNKTASDSDILPNVMQYNIFICRFFFFSPLSKPADRAIIFTFRNFFLFLIWAKLSPKGRYLRECCQSGPVFWFLNMLSTDACNYTRRAVRYGRFCVKQRRAVHQR